MTLSAVINGVIYTEFKEYDVSRSVEDVAGQFSLTLTTSGFKGVFQNGDKIVIYVGKTPVLTGHIEKKKVNYDAQTHNIEIQGRDNVGDLVDSTIGNKIEFKAPVTLEKIIQSVLSDIQMTGVKVINQVTGLKAFSSDEVVSGEIDETILEFLEKYTRKRQVLMTTDGKGNMILARAGTVHAATPLLHRVEGSSVDQNNILDSEVEFDDTKRFYLYRVHSQGNPSAQKKKTPANNDFLNDIDRHLGASPHAPVQNSPNHKIANRLASATDPDVRHTRVLDITAESATSVSDLTERAVWEASVRRARAITYRCRIQGHTITTNGKPWEPNLLVSVVDEYALMDTSLLIKSVKYSLAVEGGNITELELVHPDSYLPEPSTLSKKGKHGKVGRKKKKKAEKNADFLRDIDGHLKDFPAGG